MTRFQSGGIALLLFSCSTHLALGRDFRVNMLPNAQRLGGQGCIACHTSPNGGGARNAFGLQVQQVVPGTSSQPFWRRVFNLDADNDGQTNGEELGDPNGLFGTEFFEQPAGFTPSQPANRTSQQPAPPEILPIELLSALGENTLEMSWTGGKGPFLIQRKLGLEDSLWQTAGSSEAPSFTWSLSEPHSFFQIQELDTAPPQLFTSQLLGAFEVPNPVETSGSGYGNFRIIGNTLWFDVHYSGLTGPAIAAHIHGPAGASESTGVMINLAPFNGGAFGESGVFEGTVDLTASQKAAILTGKTYVNIHTDMHGSGEIRGQIAPVQWAISLNGSADRPNTVLTHGNGMGLLSLVGNELTFRVQYSELSAAATAAHIHGPSATDTTGPVLINLAPFNGGAFGSQGVLSGTVSLSPDQLIMLLNEETYINIHTSNFTGGEIRGQIAPQVSSLAFTAHISGGNEKPEAVETTGSGFGQFHLLGDQLIFQINYENLSAAATAAHFHGPATAAEPAGVLLNLQAFHEGPYGTSGQFKGSVTLTPEQRDAVLNGKVYVNIHTSNHTGGEVRGQVSPFLMAASVNGQSERPALVETAGKGSLIAALMGNQISFQALYANLSGDATLAHIHGPAGLNETVGVLFNLDAFNGGAFSSTGRLSGVSEVSDAHLQAIVDGRTYINIHTAQNGSGEIRGQVLPLRLDRTVLVAEINGANERPTPVNRPGTGQGIFTIVGQKLNVLVQYNDLSAVATGAHIHGPATVTETNGIIIDLAPLNGGAFDTSGVLSGEVDLTAQQKLWLLSGLTYVNFHTSNHPQGEIRGQIVRP